MKKQLLCLTALFISLLGSSQVRVGITGGYHHNFAGPDYFLPETPFISASRTSVRSGHFGVSAEIPVRDKHWFFKTGIVYFKRGQLQNIVFDSSQARLHFTKSSQKINYIDLPLALAFKYALKKNVRFIIGGGPQLSLFIAGQEVATTSQRLIGKNRAGNDSAYTSIKEVRQDKLLVGKEDNRYRLSFFSISGFGGFEFKKLSLTASYSKGLTPYFTRPDAKLEHDSWSATLGLYIFRTNPETIAVKFIDADNDGIEDGLDSCPTEAGPALTGGCPDTDGDGVTDQKDSCPDINGLAKYNGCPVPDTDGDGVNDEKDACPQQQGTTANKGCPEVIKEEPVVKKPEVVEVLTEKAVEQINLSAKSISFKFRQAELTDESYKVLDEIIGLLRTANVKIRVEGHSSLEGNPKSNLRLSQERAENVKQYFVKQGIAEERITATGFGSTKPLIKGSSEKANVQNRRVEIIVDK